MIVVRYRQGDTRILTQKRNSTRAIEEVPSWLTAVRAAESKKALDLKVLDLREVTSFTDHFVICTGTNSRQVQAIADEVEEQMEKSGHKPVSKEGYKNAEWVLTDFGDLVVHVFSEKARAYYELDRLWREAKEVEVPVEEPVRRVRKKAS
jgi:ribosome-associated protein